MYGNKFLSNLKAAKQADQFTLCMSGLPQSNNISDYVAEVRVVQLFLIL